MRILTTREAANLLRTTEITMLRLLRAGVVPGFKLGHVWRIDLDALLAWMRVQESLSGLPSSAASSPMALSPATHRER